MKLSEFDKFAEEYKSTLNASVSLSGDSSDYFAEYKIKEVSRECMQHKIFDGEILDFGCGTGTSTPYFKKYFRKSKLTGVDVSNSSLEIAKSRFGDVDYVQFDGSKLPYKDNSFDIIFTACVFHHIDEEQHGELLSEIRRVLTPEGRFFLFEHNPFNPLTIKIVNNCPFDENAVLIPSGKIITRLRGANFSAVRRRYCLFFPKFLSFLRNFEPKLYWCPLGAQYYVSAGK